MIDERARHELYLAVEEVLGTQRADTLMALLPPVGWADVATKEDLHHLEARLVAAGETRFGQVDRGFGQVDRRFEQVDRRFAEVDHRFALLEATIDTRFTRAQAHTDARFAVVDARLEQIDGRFTRIDARFSQLEGQIDRSVREQTRTLMLGLVGAMFTMTSLCLGAVALAT